MSIAILCATFFCIYLIMFDICFPPWRNATVLNNPMCIILEKSFLLQDLAHHTHVWMFFENILRFTTFFHELANSNTLKTLTIPIAILIRSKCKKLIFLSACFAS